MTTSKWICAMEHDVAYWYSKYETYMQSLAADILAPSGILLRETPNGLRSHQFTLEEFRAMWALILLDSELTDRWVRHLTDGYERDKTKVLTLLDNALSAVPVATESSQGRRKESVAA
jgi:hypothetical protein